MSGKTVMVLGGGVGGLATARALRKRLPKTHRVVLVERQPQFLFAPSLLWLAVGKRQAGAIQRPVADLAGRGVEVILGEIQHIDVQTRTVQVDGQAHAADALVVSLGVDLDEAAIPGLQEAGHDLYTLAGAQGFHRSLQDLKAGRLVVLTAAPAYRCPAAPYEAALLAEAFLRQAGVRAAVEVEVHAAEPAPMPVAGPAVSQAVRGLLSERQVRYVASHQVERVDSAQKVLHFTDGQAVAFDLLGYVPPHRPPAVVRQSGLLGPSGWIEVDRATMETRWDGVYAIGDNVLIPLAMGKPLPKAGVFAHRQGEVVAERIAAHWRAEAATARFDGHGECLIEVGDGRAGYGGGDFYAEPVPRVELKQPSRRWHLAKVAFEKSWLHGWF